MGGKYPTTLYLVVPPSDISRTKPLVRLILNQIGRRLTESLDKLRRKGRLSEADVEAARSWVAGFVEWYNTKHKHSAIRFVTPDQRHFGHEAELLAKRAALYELARRRNPNRWSCQSRNWSPAPAVRLGPVRTRVPTKEVVIH